MQFLRNGKMLLAMVLGVSVTAWGQGGSGRAGRAAAAQQAAAPQTGAPQGAPPAAAQGRGGRGFPPAPVTSEFYDYNTSAGNAGSAPFEAPPAETHQKITVNGEALAYTTRAGYLPLRNATTGQTEAHVFYTCYAKEGGGDPAARPLLFFFGGAPGVSAGWQEFGGLGPKRMRWASDGSAGAPPYSWADNPHTLLAQADLVFVNPVGTAFSRSTAPNRGPSFWNTSADVASLAEFVRSFLAVYNRRNSPLILAGEDFGTARVSGLAAYLHEHEIPVDGVVLLSLETSADSRAGDAQYLTELPSLTMAAWHQKKLAPELNAMGAEQISAQARQFASREYLHALYKGDRMTPEERAKVIADLSRLTGVSKAFIVNNELRIPPDRFITELLHDQHRGLSASDTRVSGFVPLPAGGGRGGFGAPAAAPLDFNLTSRGGGFATAYEAYLHGELKFNSGSGIFYLSNGGVGPFTLTGSDDVSLSAAFARNPRLRLFVGVNYYDLTVPFYAEEFTLAHLNVSPEVRAHNITVGHFDAGQMPYTDDKALAKLQAALAGFVSQATAQGSK